MEECALKWLSSANGATSSLIRRKAAINKFGKFLGVGDIVTDYRLPPSPLPKPHPLPNGIDDVRLMLDSAGDDYLLVFLMGMMGLRVSEAVSVTWDDYDPSTNMVRVFGKGRKERDIPAPGAVLLDGSLNVPRGSNERLVNLGNSTARAHITEIAQRAGISRPVASHDLRATFATDIYLRTKDVRVVQLLLGHASVATTQRYIGVDTDIMRSAMPMVEA